LDQPYPGGESWRQAIARVGRFLDDLPLRWSDQRLLIVGHTATWWGLEHFIGGEALEDLAEQDLGRREGWEYRLGQAVSFAGTDEGRRARPSTHSPTPNAANRSDT
jgi:2,3-bisphosphoglycerate-dependent phosphoglycerate mutase